MTKPETPNLYPIAELLIATSGDKLKIAVDRGESAWALAAYFKKVLHVFSELVSIMAIQIDDTRYVLSNGQVVLTVENIPPNRVITLEKIAAAKVKTDHLRGKKS